MKRIYCLFSILFILILFGIYQQGIIIHRQGLMTGQGTKIQPTMTEEATTEALYEARSTHYYWATHDGGKTVGDMAFHQKWVYIYDNAIFYLEQK